MRTPEEVATSTLGHEPINDHDRGTWSAIVEAIRADRLQREGCPDPVREKAIKAEALREVATSFLDWDVIYGHEPATPEIERSHRTADWLMAEADRWEGKELPV